MAMLKSTYVDGKLTIGDTIQVNNIESFKGRNFPYIDLENSSPVKMTGRLPVYSNEKSGLASTSLAISEEFKPPIDGSQLDTKQYAVTVSPSTQNSANKVTTLLLDVESTNIAIHSVDIVVANKEWSFQKQSSTK